MKAVPLRLGRFGLCVLLGACATAGPGADDSDDDSNVTPGTDAQSPDAAPPVDPPPDARPSDASPPTPDAPPSDGPCSPTTTQLLVNPAFDSAPMGTGWNQAPFDPMYPLVTDADGVAERTAPYKVWLGGIDASTDSMFQEVAVPLGTTTLVLRGEYEVRTSEWLPFGAYDFGYVELTNSAGTVLDSVLAVTDDNATTAWTPFLRQFSGNYGGQTVRIRLRATNDGSDSTSFFFDSLALDATGCP